MTRRRADRDTTAGSPKTVHDPLPDATDSQEPDPELTLPEALQWLQRLRPVDALALIRTPEAAFIAARAFLGFRINPQGYANPIVRARLAQELVRDGEFRERVRSLLSLVALETGLSASSVPGASPPAAVESNNTPSPSADLKRRLQTEVQQRKKDRSEARTAIDEARETANATRRELETAREALLSAEQERDSLKTATDRATQRTARLERQINRLRHERDVLLKSASKQDTPTTPKVTGKAANIRDSANRPPVVEPSPFEAAAYRLLERGNADAALGIAEDVLRIAPRNIAALDIAATVYRQSGRCDLATSTTRELIVASLDSGEIDRASNALASILILDAETPLLEQVSRPYIAALRAADAGQLRQAATLFARLRKMSPTGFSRLAQLIGTHGTPALVSALLVSQSTLGPGDPLPFRFPRPVTANGLILAIDTGDVATVESVREALDKMREARATTEYDATLAAIETAADGDDSYMRPLMRRPRGDVIVDASNVAWYDDTTGMAEKPRLKTILQVRSTLRLRGYFPIHLIGDAPLPYTIDDRDRFRKMMTRREIQLVDTGTDADEVILREARRLHAPIVTNDYMADWDPNQEVQKIRYAVPSAGNAYLLE